MKILYEELLEKYNLLLEENRNLKREIAILRNKSKIAEQNFEEKNNDKIIVSMNKFSSPQEKIKLYRSLFRGRERMFLPDVGTVKIRTKAVISLFVKKNGIERCATRKNINARLVPIASLRFSRIRIFTSIYQVKIYMAGTSLAFIRC